MAGHSRPKDGVASLPYVPAIHVFLCSQAWMPGTRPGTTWQGSALHRLQQHVTLASERQLDDAFGRQMLRRQRHFLVAHGFVVHLEPAALDLPSRVAIG